MPTRRDFLRNGALALTGALVPDVLRAQQTGAANVPMDQGSYRSVRLAPKAEPVLSTEQRDALEHRIRCQCGCTLDVFTCRTTDFSCQVSPAMHRDVLSLVAGGYDEAEIIDAFTGVYGARVLMAPPKVGFNWAGYLAPFVAIAGGATLIAVLIRRWRHADAPPAPVAVDATPDELARLDALVRRDDR
jgi:cytochrome c-type biogenesis protein CcmH